MRAVVLNLLLVRFAQDSGDMLASLDTLFDGNNDGAVCAAILLMADDEAGAGLDDACFHADKRSSACVQAVTSFDHNLQHAFDYDGRKSPPTSSTEIFFGTEGHNKVCDGQIQPLGTAEAPCTSRHVETTVCKRMCHGIAQRKQRHYITTVAAGEQTSTVWR